MFRSNMISGEPEFHSPPNDNFGLISEEEATYNANLTPMGGGGYSYDTTQRFQQLYQQEQLRGNYPTMSGFEQFMTAPGYYAGNNQGQPLPPGANPVLTMFGPNSGMANSDQPFYGLGGGQQLQERVVRVPGYSPGGEMMPPADIEEKIAQLQLEMEIELDEAYQEKLNRQKEFFERTGGVSYNYYNTPTFGAYYNDPVIIGKYRKIIEGLRNEAIEKRSSLNRHLSKLCHNFTGNEISDEDIDKVYADKFVTVSVQDQQYDYTYDLLSKCKEYDPAEPYKRHFIEVSEKHNKYFNGGEADLTSFLNNAGEMLRDEALEKEVEKNRDAKGYYAQDGSFKNLLRRRVYERRTGQTLQENQPIPVHGENMLMASGLFPTLANSATLLEDGSLQINRPAWQGGTGQSPILIRNEMEENYEKNRDAFMKSIYQNDPRPGGGS